MSFFWERADAGPRILPDVRRVGDRRELVLDAFVLVESSCKRGTAVVRSLVEAKGGTVAIDEGPMAGARLVVGLPALRT